MYLRPSVITAVCGSVRRGVLGRDIDVNLQDTAVVQAGSI